MAVRCFLVLLSGIPRFFQLIKVQLNILRLLLKCFNDYLRRVKKPAANEQWSMAPKTARLFSAGTRRTNRLCHFLVNPRQIIGLCGQNCMYPGYSVLLLGPSKWGAFGSTPGHFREVPASLQGTRPLWRGTQDGPLRDKIAGDAHVAFPNQST